MATVAATALEFPSRSIVDLLVDRLVLSESSEFVSRRRQWGQGDCIQTLSTLHAPSREICTDFYNVFLVMEHARKVLSLIENSAIATLALKRFQIDQQNNKLLLGKIIWGKKFTTAQVAPKFDSNHKSDDTVPFTVPFSSSYRRDRVT